MAPPDPQSFDASRAAHSPRIYRLNIPPLNNANVGAAPDPIRQAAFRSPRDFR